MSEEGFGVLIALPQRPSINWGELDLETLGSNRLPLREPAPVAPSLAFHPLIPGPRIGSDTFVQPCAVSISADLVPLGP